MKSKKISVKFDGNMRAICYTLLWWLLGYLAVSPSPGRSPAQTFCHPGEARMRQAQLLDLARVCGDPSFFGRWWRAFSVPLICRGH